MIPHVTNPIKDFILRDTAGEISSSARSAALSATSRACHSSRRSASSATICPKQAIYLHLTVVPSIAGELKTKPTQHSVKELRSIGIQPNILLCRSEREIPRGSAQNRTFLQRAESAVIEP